MSASHTRLPGSAVDPCAPRGCSHDRPKLQGPERLLLALVHDGLRRHALRAAALLVAEMDDAARERGLEALEAGRRP
jgi:hypothetical protein